MSQTANFGSTSDRPSSIAELFRAIEARDAELIASFFHENAVYRRPGRPVLIGRGAVETYYGEERPALTSNIYVEKFFESDDGVVATGLVEGRQRDGQKISERFSDIFVFEDGLIRDRTTYFYRAGF